jgi:uncharacterized membrane protein YraQ (UPF0718 family)
VRERYKLLVIVGVFLFFYFVPLGGSRIQGALLEGFHMLQEYARLHVLLCLVPAFFIAGAIQNFISKEAIIKYFGPKSNKVLAYSIASISGAILAVCSCTVLPMFMGIYTAGAGLGVAVSFLYSGPAINVLAILMTGRVLGLELGLARAIGAIVFSVVIGLLMAFIFFRSEKTRADASGAFDTESAKGGRRLWQNILYFASMILALIFMTWAKPKEPIGVYNAVFSVKWTLQERRFSASC